MMMMIIQVDTIFAFFKIKYILWRTFHELYHEHDQFILLFICIFESK